MWTLLAASPANFACATARPTVVSPAEIPIFEARLEAEPGSGADLHRYAAALFSADRCEEAVAYGRRVMAFHIIYASKKGVSALQLGSPRDGSPRIPEDPMCGLHR